MGKRIGGFRLPRNKTGRARQVVIGMLAGVLTLTSVGLDAGPAAAAQGPATGVTASAVEFASSGAVAGTAPSVAATTTATTRGTATACRAPIVYLVPHQDDELLSMAASIRRSLGRSGSACVHVVLVTTGQSSGARTLMARGFKAVGQQRFTQYALSRQRFGASRDAEFRAALGRLGVAPGNVHLGLARAPRVADDGSLTPAVAERFTGVTIATFGRGAGYATMSDSDPQSDHRTLGMALRKVGRQRGVASVSFFYPPYRLPSPRRLSPTVATGADRTAIRAAAMEYGKFAPAAGRYGIGWLSVAPQFGGSALGIRLINTQGVPRGVLPMRSPKTPLMDGYTSLLHR